MMSTSGKNNSIFDIIFGKPLWYILYTYSCEQVCIGPIILNFNNFHFSAFVYILCLYLKKDTIVIFGQKFSEFWKVPIPSPESVP